MKNKRIDSFLLDYRYTKLCIHFYCVSDNNKIYKFWMYYFGSLNNFSQDPPPVYSISLSGHIDHLRIVLSLRTNQLYVNIDKYNFCLDSVVILGFIVNKNEFHVDKTRHSILLI